MAYVNKLKWFVSHDKTKDNHDGYRFTCSEKCTCEEAILTKRSMHTQLHQDLGKYCLFYVYKCLHTYVYKYSISYVNNNVDTHTTL